MYICTWHAHPMCTYILYRPHKPHVHLYTPLICHMYSYIPYILHGSCTHNAYSTNPMHTICSHVLCNTYKIYIAHTCHLINHIAYIPHIVHNSTDRPQVPYMHYSHPMHSLTMPHTLHTHPLVFQRSETGGSIWLVHLCLGHPSFLLECCFPAPLSPVALPTDHAPG